MRHELGKYKRLPWLRVRPGENSITQLDFHKTYGPLEPGDTRDEKWVVYGKAAIQSQGVERGQANLTLNR